MGIFSSKKITYVASSAYNMAGDYPDRMNYLKTVVLGGVLGYGYSEFIGESITNAMINGPYTGQKGLLRWAKNNDYPGVPKATLGGSDNLDPDVVEPYVEATVGYPVVIDQAFASKAAAEQWAQQYVYANYPDEADELDWTYDLYSANPPIVTIDIVGHGVHNVPMANYNEQDTYAYITYRRVTTWTGDPYPVPASLKITPEQSGNNVGYIKGSLGTLDQTIFADYELQSALFNTVSKVLTIVLSGRVQFMDQYALVYNSINRVPTLTYDVATQLTTLTYSIPDYVWEVEVPPTEPPEEGEEPPEPVFELVPMDFSFLLTGDVSPSTYEEYGNPLMLIYRYGSGNPIMEPTKPVETTMAGQFMPFAPIRIENKFINEDPYEEEYYDKVKKFYKRASGGKSVDKLIEIVKDNESIDDIDFAFMIFGVALNTKSRFCKRYLYEFIEMLMNEQTATKADFDLWLERTEQRAVKGQEVLDKAEQLGTFDTPEVAAIYAQYTAIKVPEMKYNTISQKSEWLPDLYQVFLHWCYCSQEIVPAGPHADKAVNDVWLEKGTVKSVDTIQLIKRRSGGRGDYNIEKNIETDKFDQFWIYKKVSENTVTRIFVMGFKQENIVYNGQAVWTGAVEALNDEEESDLIVPIHMETFKKLSAKARNQVSVENGYMLFNCYKIVKQRWYQRGIFKIIFAIVIAIASVFFAPAGAFGVGLLGSNVALGAAMGFTAGTITAAIAGAVVNAIAGMIVSQLITTVASKVFKGKLGAILGTIIMFFGGMIANSFMSGNGFNINWGDIFNPKNILNLTNSVTKAAAAWYQADIADISETMKAEAEKYKAESTRIRDLTRDLMGMDGRGFLDPFMLIGEAVIHNESSETFLDRTLLTGSEIAELSLEMVNSFAETNLQLPEAYI